MGRPRLLIALIILTVGSAAAAALIPAGAYASQVSIDQVASFGDPASVDVKVDRHHVVVHAPAGSLISGSHQTDRPPRVDVDLVSVTGADMRLSIEAGPGPRAERVLRQRQNRPIYVVRRGFGLAWELVPGATVVVLSRRASQVELLEVIDAIEVDR